MTNHTLSLSSICHLVCPWTGTGLCLLAQVDGDAVANRHVGLGVVCGLKALYGTHDLPPCLSENGRIDFGDAEPETAALRSGHARENIFNPPHSDHENPLSD